jgi:hypothetical protein
MVCNIPIFFLKNNALLMEISGSTSVYPLPPHMLHHTVYKFKVHHAAGADPGGGAPGARPP